MEPSSYEQFGVNFVTLAVTKERVAGAVAKVAGDTVEVGPMPAGPGGVAVVTATGRIGEVVVEPSEGALRSFVATLPIDLDLEVRLAGVPHRYNGALEVGLMLTVRTAEPLALVIDVDELGESDVTVELRSSGVAAGVLKRLGNIEAEVGRHVVRVVNGRLGSEEARAVRVIDIASLIDKAWPV